MKNFYKNKKILITGGTGTLGKALVTRLVGDNEIIIYSRDEGKQALTFGGDNRIKRVIGDIRDFHKINITMGLHEPDLVIHTAALKRIDDMEIHPDECIKTNVNGSENVARAAALNKVNKCILVSTDKACQPVNVYGSSKFIAERLFTNYDYNSRSTIFSSVRYGNVIASRGSFIPLWLGLLRENKKINVTSLEMSRFLFTLEDAADTVFHALKHSEGGEVFIPQIPAYDMKTILSAVEKIHGSTIDFNIMGLRPGEKYHEDMLAKTELPFTFKVPNVNLLCVRPQYSNRDVRSQWEMYEGLEFNSSLHLDENVDGLIQLINKGIGETL